MSARYDNIEQLDELRKSGAISEDEYEQEKTRILQSFEQPQRTVIQTRERSSFGSIVFGGIVLFALLAGLYFLLKSNDGAQTASEIAPVAPAPAPAAPPAEGGGGLFGDSAGEGAGEGETGGEPSGE